MPNTPSRGGGSRFLYEPFDPSLDREYAEYKRILRKLGTPEQVQQKIDTLDALIEAQERRNWLLMSTRTIAAWTAAVATGWLAFKGILSEFLVELQK